VNWIQRIPAGFWWWATTISVFTMAGSLLILRAVVLRLPTDYFLASSAPKRALDSWPPHWRVVGLLLKNVGGALVILLGIIMLFSPGQGLLTILMGVCLVDFPGKRKIEVMLIRRRTVYGPLNWYRRRRGLEPLAIPGRERAPKSEGSGGTSSC
jgi:hypothetical protein